jgi:hypothetical protein
MIGGEVTGTFQVWEIRDNALARELDQRGDACEVSSLRILYCRTSILLGGVCLKSEC